MAVIPKTAHNISDMRTERWVHMVHSKIRELDNMSPQRSKILFLGKSHNWTRFCGIDPEQEVVVHCDNHRSIVCRLVNINQHITFVRCTFYLFIMFICFADILSRWPLFGCTFFSIRSVADPRVKGESLLAIGMNGAHFLHSKTHVSYAKCNAKNDNLRLMKL